MHRLPVRACAAAPLVLMTALALGGCAAPEAGEAGRVALVLRGPGGTVQQACVRLRERISNGEQVLLDSGWQVSLDAGNPMGSIVCAIDGEGCRFPAEDCFCQCSLLGSCSYWAYFTQGTDGQWAYSPLGARSQPAVDGDVHAWIWVTGTSAEPGAQQALLPAVTFDGVCPPG